MTHKPFVFFGTPAVAEKTLEQLVSVGYMPTLVITNPDAPAGRGSVMAPCPTKQWAEAHNIPVITPEKLDDLAIADIAAKGCEYGICVAYGKILPESLIRTFPKGIVNVHYSLLPKYRGAAPLETALLSGDSITGVTVQQMVKEMDAGDILGRKEVEITSSDTARTLRPKLIDEGAQLLIDTLPSLETGSLTPEPQDHSLATHAPKMKKEDGLVYLDDAPEQLWNTYRAFADSIGTYTFFTRSGKEIRASITDAHYDGKEFVVDTIKPAGKNEMSYADFLRSGAAPVSRS